MESSKGKQWKRPKIEGVPREKRSKENKYCRVQTDTRVC